MSVKTQSANVGLLRRLAASAYDLLLLVALWMLVTAMFLPLNDGQAPAPGSWLYNTHRLALLMISAAFFAGFWKFGGQTLGMRAWRLRVIRDDGSPLNWYDCGTRLLASVVSILPAGAGFWWALFDRDHRTWHDKLSHTHLKRMNG